MAKQKLEKEAIKVVLPTKRIPAIQSNPRNLIIMSKPKVGKTSLLAQLDNCLILDLEKGTDFVDALKVKITDIEDIKTYGKEILAQTEKDGKPPYKYIAIDTITKLEEMCVDLAEILYSKSLMGKEWFTKHKSKYGNILNMPNGAGYQWLRQAFEKVIAYVSTLAPHIILIAHIKDSIIDKSGSEFTSSDIDLTGKIKRITASSSDAIGYLYRKGNQNILSFKTNDEVACGARCKHLSNADILVSEKQDDNSLITHWDKIFIK